MKTLNISNFIKNTKKTTFVIIALFFLNVVTFSFILSQIKTYQTTENNSELVAGKNKYIKAGSSVFNWSYRMLLYFKN